MVHMIIEPLSLFRVGANAGLHSHVIRYTFNLNSITLHVDLHYPRVNWPEFAASEMSGSAAPIRR